MGNAQASGASSREPVPEAGSGDLDWVKCEGAEALPEAQCATMRVPLDWRNRNGPKISLALSRLPATDPDNRIGPLLFNPGGPGGSGLQAVAYSPLLAGAPEFTTLREHFDIVGFDPRGVGASTPVTCKAPLHNPSLSTFPATPLEFAKLAKFNHAAGMSCRKETGPLIDHVSTKDVVRDMAAIRIALGAPRLSFLGLSYGTEIGSLYAERYPHRVRTMVLDGNVDHGVPARRAALDEARATESLFKRFAAWCATDEKCALRNADVPGLFDKVMATASETGVPAASLGRNANAEEMTSGAYGLLNLRAAWPSLAGALAQAAGLAGEADASGLVATAMFADPSYAPYRAVGCHDFAPTTKTLKDMSWQAAKLREAAPHMWRYSEFWDWTSGCLGWPVRPGNRPVPLKVEGAPPVLLVNTTHDPATPYTWAQSLSAAIDGSRLLTVEAEGHTATLHSSCARSTYADYLVTGELPPADTVCPASDAS
ncbi:alpha/beta hydrolase [Streptomyces clavifer]|uniref:alpha/beta hydrolase n=1 Tax=Streptomyces clavifer TaxID=68188 RepID=UPI0036B0C749